MRKIMNWVLAVTFICGASVFTSCSANDANDNPSQEQAKKDRKEFIQHTRQNLKEVAENLNFSSWEQFYFGVCIFFACRPNRYAYCGCGERACYCCIKTLFR